MTIPNNFGLLIVLFSLSYNSSVMVTNPYLLKNTDFVDAIAMLCLPCNKKAVVSGGQIRDTVGFDNAIQFTCTHCGHAIKYTNTSKFSVFTTNRGVAKYAGILFFDSQTVPYFNFPLWSMVKIPWSIIWRYKALHLKVLENYIASKKRSRNGISHEIKANLVPNHLTDDPNDFVAPVVLERMLSVSDLCKVDLSRCGAEVSVKDMPQHLGLFLEETQQQIYTNTASTSMALSALRYSSKACSTALPGAITPEN